MDQDDYRADKGNADDTERGAASKKMKSDTGQSDTSTPQANVGSGPTPMQHQIVVTPLGKNRPSPPLKQVVMMNGTEKLPLIAVIKPKKGFRSGPGSIPSKFHPCFLLPSRSDLLRTPSQISLPFVGPKPPVGVAADTVNAARGIDSEGCMVAADCSLHKQQPVPCVATTDSEQQTALCMAATVPLCSLPANAEAEHREEWATRSASLRAEAQQQLAVTASTAASIESELQTPFLSDNCCDFLSPNDLSVAELAMVEATTPKKQGKVLGAHLESGQPETVTPAAFTTPINTPTCTEVDYASEVGSVFLDGKRRSARTNFYILPMEILQQMS